MKGVVMTTISDHPAARVVRGGEPYRSPQGTVYAPGISSQTAASRVLFMGLVTLPPGERTKAHIHEQHESAFYLLSGPEVELWSGQRLEHRSVARAGDYLLIPAGVAHVAVNRSSTEPAIFVGARNEPTASESVVMMPHLDACVP
jgi:uncharacterized RmlC-like cupin family protein